MRFETWLQSWLSRHPLKEPPAKSPSAYTAEVMSRVKSKTAPAGSSRARLAVPLWEWPRLRVVLATACAGVVIAVGISRYRATQLAQSLIRQSEQLAELAGPEQEALIEADDVKTIASDWEEMDRLMLAESDRPSTTDDAKWIDELSRVLNQLDEDVSGDDASSDVDQDQWLDELEMLEQTGNTASS